MKRYMLIWVQILSVVCIVYYVGCFVWSASPRASEEITPLYYYPQCPSSIHVSCPSAWCLTTLKPCYPTGPELDGVCCVDIWFDDLYGCCQYKTKNARICKCTDENGVQRVCVDQYGYAYYSGDCTRIWDMPDFALRCCTEGRLKGNCEYISYPCN